MTVAGGSSFVEWYGVQQLPWQPISGKQIIRKRWMYNHLKSMQPSPALYSVAAVSHWRQPAITTYFTELLWQHESANSPSDTPRWLCRAVAFITTRDCVFQMIEIKQLDYNPIKYSCTHSTVAREPKKYFLFKQMGPDLPNHHWSKNY